MKGALIFIAIIVFILSFGIYCINTERLITEKRCKPLQVINYNVKENYIICGGEGLVVKKYGNYWD